jgi:trehalose 6-phosphate phosphatase
MFWTKEVLHHFGHATEIRGSHGLESLKQDGSYEIAPVDEAFTTGLALADDWIAENGLEDLSEKKPGSVAIHWRGLGDTMINRIRNIVEPEWSFIATNWELRFTEFDGGLELLIPFRDKGAAVKTILGESQARTISVYFGDDLSDEDAFTAIRGSGLGVLVRRQLRRTVADIWITPPEELLYFLSHWI